LQTAPFGFCNALRQIVGRRTDDIGDELHPRRTPGQFGPSALGVPRLAQVGRKGPAAEYVFERIGEGPLRGVDIRIVIGAPADQHGNDVFGIAEFGESVDLQADVVRAARCRRTQHDQRPRVQKMQFQCRFQAVAGHVAEVTEHVEVPAS